MQNRTVTVTYENLKGVDFSRDAALVDRSRSPYCENMMPDESKSPVKRPGWQTKYSLTGVVHNIWLCTVKGEKYMLCHCGDKIYSLGDTAVVLKTGVTDGKGCGFYAVNGNDGGFYILTSGEYLVFDRLPELIAGRLNSFIDAVAGKFAGYYTKEEVLEVVSDSLINAGAGDMTKGVYDANNSGVVDNAERLGGELPGYYAVKAEAKMKTLSAMTDLGLDATANFAETVAAVPGYTRVFLQPNSLTDVSWKLPISQGYIEITRRYGTRQVSAIAVSSLGEMHIATIDTSGVPTGVWNKVTLQADLAAYMPVAGGEFTGTAKATSNLVPGPYIRNNRVTSSEGTGAQYNVSTNNIVFRRKV